MELLSYFCVDWNEGEGIRKAVWISGDSPGHPLELQKLVFVSTGRGVKKEIIN